MLGGQVEHASDVVRVGPILAIRQRDADRFAGLVANLVGNVSSTHTPSTKSAAAEGPSSSSCRRQHSTHRRWCGTRATRPVVHEEQHAASEVVTKTIHFAPSSGAVAAGVRQRHRHTQWHTHRHTHRNTVVVESYQVSPSASAKKAMAVPTVTHNTANATKQHARREQSDEAVRCGRSTGQRSGKEEGPHRWANSSPMSRCWAGGSKSQPPFPLPLPGAGSWRLPPPLLTTTARRKHDLAHTLYDFCGLV